MIPLTDADIRRFHSKVERRGADECWPWCAYRDKHGYGKINIGHVVRIAPRVAFQIEYGFLPSVVGHHCDNPPCCNPRHLFGGTQLDNYRDMEAKGRSGAGKAHRDKNHCPHGHPYSIENTRVRARADGGVRRSCKACECAQARAYHRQTLAALSH